MTEDKAPITQLEEEGDIAADYLEELLDIIDYEGDIDIDVENGRASLEIASEEFGDRWLRRLVGEDGEVLEATAGADQAGGADQDRGAFAVDAGHRWLSARHQGTALGTGRRRLSPG